MGPPDFRQTTVVSCSRQDESTQVGASDRTTASRTQIGDLVELWGPNIAANDIAARSDTIGYELLTGVSSRVPRIYD